MKEQALSSVSLGSLAIIALVRAIKSNLLGHRVRFPLHSFTLTLLINIDLHDFCQDPFFHTNCFACLCNMSNYVDRIHPYAAQRLTL